MMCVPKAKITLEKIKIRLVLSPVHYTNFTFKSSVVADDAILSVIVSLVLLKWGYINFSKKLTQSVQKSVFHSIPHFSHKVVGKLHLKNLQPKRSLCNAAKSIILVSQDGNHLSSHTRDT